MERKIRFFQVASISLIALFFMIFSGGLVQAATSEKVLEVSYIHQRFDTSSDFVGAYASAPSSAVMILDYYGKLPSSKSPGDYVSKSYLRGGKNFDQEASVKTNCKGKTASGRGAWGYIWKDSRSSDKNLRVRQNLQAYLEKHGLETAISWSPDDETAKDLIKNQIKDKNPVIARVFPEKDRFRYVVITGYREKDNDFEFLVNDPNGHREVYKDYPCWGCYTEARDLSSLGIETEKDMRKACPQPASYTYSELGLGKSSRALISVNMDSEGKEESESSKDEGGLKREEVDFVENNDIIRYPTEKKIERDLKDYMRESNDYLAFLALDSSYNDDEKHRNLVQKKVEELRELRESEKKKENRGFLGNIRRNVVGFFSRALGFHDKECIAVGSVIEDGNPSVFVEKKCKEIGNKWYTKKVEEADRDENYDVLSERMVGRILEILRRKEKKSKESKENSEEEKVDNKDGMDYHDLDITDLKYTDKSEIREYLEDKGAEEMLKYVDDLYELGKEYNIDPAFAAAVMAHESSWASSEAYRKCRNGFGQMDNDDIDYQKCREHSDHKDLVKYPNIKAGIETFYRRIREVYVNENGQRYPHEISCVWKDESPTDPCYVGPGGTDRRSWNANVPRIIQEIRNYEYRGDEYCDHLIILDPGHGGPQPGTTTGTIDEKTLNLGVVHKLKRKLMDYGYRNILFTRSVDRNLTLFQRTKFANDAYHNGYNMDNAIFLSVHANSHDEPEVNGTETFYHPGPQEPRRKRSEELARKVENEISSSLGFYSRGAKTDGNLNDWKGLWVTVKTDMPAALTETGFLTNEENRVKIESEEGREDAAEGIKEGIVRYFESRNFPESCLQ